MEQASVYDQIQGIEKLPPFRFFAGVLAGILKAEHTADLRDIISTIESEPTIAAQVISIANSAYYAGTEPVLSVKTAAARLGIGNLKSIILGLVVANKFDTQRCPGFQISRFWQDAMLVAKCAARLSQHSIEKIECDRESIYTIGLLHNIGLLVLVYLYPDRMNAVLESADQQDLKQQECAAFGLDHYDAGAALLKHWNLPDVFTTTIANINKRGYSGNFVKIVNVVQAAKQWAKMIKPDEHLYAALGLTKVKVQALQEACEDERKSIADFAVYL
jgi:HD-like signal output (HDOD) protein